MKTSKTITHFSVAALVTVILLTAYTMVQQTYRTSADDPQLTLAKEIQLHIEHNTTYAHLLPVDSTELAESEGVFVAIYNANGQLLQTNAMVHGQPPAIPQGVLEAAKANGVNSVSWQPSPGIREALVVNYVNNAHIGYIACGRSLYNTEIREANLKLLLITSWIIAMAIIIIHATVQYLLYKKSK